MSTAKEYFKAVLSAILLLGAVRIFFKGAYMLIYYLNLSTGRTEKVEAIFQGSTSELIGHIVILFLLVIVLASAAIWVWKAIDIEIRESIEGFLKDTKNTLFELALACLVGRRTGPLLYDEIQERKKVKEAGEKIEEENRKVLEEESTETEEENN